MLHLVHCALARLFIRAPSKNLRAVPKTSTGEVIIGHLHHDFFFEKVNFKGCVVKLVYGCSVNSRTIIFLPWSRARVVGCTALVITYIAATLGTFARTGLVSLLLLGILLLWQSKRRVLVGAFMLLTAACLLAVVGPEWQARMETIGTSDASAASRIDAWTWALQYVQEHPFGGAILYSRRTNYPAIGRSLQTRGQS